MSEEDPVVASYDVYIAKDSPNLPADTSDLSKPRLLVLQYPSHRPQSRPYNEARSQKPTALRLKAETGVVEVEVPIITREHYNAEQGARYRKTLDESKAATQGGTYGLAGGFNTIHGGGGLQSSDMRDIPAHHDTSAVEEDLDTQILGGKMVKPTPRDPIYMLGTFRKDQLHLAHLDALVQLRPQLHHLDAQDELTQRRSAAAVAKAKVGDPTAPPKLESKAIDVKLKDNNHDAKDRNLNTNARLLRNIQNEAWKIYEWIDQADPASHDKFTRHMYLDVPVGLNISDRHSIPGHVPRLKSVISNGEWLDKMSAPRETGHGKKGLLAKLRGRERERARRRKNEEVKIRKAQEAVGVPTSDTGVLDHHSGSSDSSHSADSDSDDSGAGGREINNGDGKDVAMVDLINQDEIEIKEEPASNVVGAPVTLSTMSDSTEVTRATTAKAVAKKKGRPPRKGQVDGAIDLDD